MSDALGPRAANDALWATRRPAMIADATTFASATITDAPALVIYEAADIVPATIPPRRWLLGTSFCRGFLSALTAEGAVAKTSLRHLQYLAVATGKNLTGEYVHHRVPVLVVCLEDSLEEIQRRLAAAMLQYHIAADAVRGWLFYACPQGLKMLRVSPRGTHVIGELYDEIARIVKERGIGLVGVDPLVKAHDVDENSNSDMDELCTMLSRLAIERDCAVDFIHHARKGVTQPGDASRSRGASATVAAARLVRTVSAMTPEEAELFNVTPANRALYVRVDDAKLNIAPRSADAAWFRLTTVALGNGTPDYPGGDTVPTVERWYPPDLWRVPAATLNVILDEIDAGPATTRRYTDGSAAGERAAWHVVAKHLGYTQKQAREMIRTWVKTGVLIVEDYDDPVDRKPRKGLRVNPTKRPG